MDLQPGTILKERYTIIRQLGLGGMGAVFLANDTALDHEVAVKVNRSTSPHAAAQFMREARLLASLRHPNLPRVTDYFLLGEEQYLVMDYIPGMDLGEVLKKQGRVHISQVIKWAAQLGSALTYLHGQNPPIIHRDIKPANIRLISADEVALVDFGIAKVAEAGQATSTGAMGYTPGYAPPEQYGTGHTGPYSDQYSLAATIYNLLTGEKPADSVQRLLGQGQLTPLSSVVPDIPYGVQAVLERGLAVRPEDRYPSVAEFISDLTAAFQGLTPSIQAPMPVRDWQTSTSYPGSEPTAQLGGAAARTAVDQPPQRPPTQPPAFTGPASAPPPLFPTAGEAAGLPTRKKGIPVWLIVVLAVFAIAGVITGILVAGSSTAAVAPEPTMTLFPTRAATTVSPSATASQKPAVQAPTATPEPKFPVIGRLAFVSDRSGGSLEIWQADVAVNNSGEYVPENLKQLTFDGLNKYQPVWSPDGTRLLYVADSGKTIGGKPAGLDIWVLNLNDLSTGGVNLTNRAGNDFQAAWSPDGQWIYFVTDSRDDKVKQLMRMRPDGSELVRTSTFWQEYGPAWSPDSRKLLIVQSGPGYDYLAIYDMQVTGTPVAYDRNQLPGRPGVPSDPAWAPSGSVIAYVKLDGQPSSTPAEGPWGRIAVAPYPLRGDDVITILTSGGQDRDPAWSPDSQYIAFTSQRTGDKEVFIMLANGTRQLNFTNRKGVDMQPAWYPIAP